ncbi:hypothetical protein D3C81_2333980 [compost metagenome]
MAFDIAVAQYLQPGLFVDPDALSAEFWRGVQLAAMNQLDECEALREAMGHG